MRQLPQVDRYLREGKWQIMIHGESYKPIVAEAARKAANEVYDETSAKNPDFKKIYEAVRAFRNEEYLWFQVAEYTFDNFMIRARARG